MNRSIQAGLLAILAGCSDTEDQKSSEGGSDSTVATTNPDSAEPEDTASPTALPDPNGDGALNILVLGTNQSYGRRASFSPDGIAAALQAVLEADPSAPEVVQVVAEDIHMSAAVAVGLGGGTNQSYGRRASFSPDGIAAALQAVLEADPSAPEVVQVVAEDIHMSAAVAVGLGGGGDEYNYTHHSHSLLQYYYWPDGQAERMAHLASGGGTAWDYVVLGGDPHIVAHMPGYHALGVHKVAAKVAEGGAQPLLLMMWPEEGVTDATIARFEEVSYRVADGAAVELPVVPAGLAWDALAEADRDEADVHPTPTGATLAAHAIFSHLVGRTAGEVGDPLAETALTAVVDAATATHYDGERSGPSPFDGCAVTDDVISYNHTGSSSENGILDGLRWVFDQAPQTLQNGGTTPITFNYGRANTNFEPGKRYEVDTDRFAFSFGFPMQDHGNTGNVSMLYGLDSRDSGVVNDTDLGVAEYMVTQGELPHARAVPIRTLFAQMRELDPEQSAYRDSWHMHRDLDKAIAAYMYTVLTGDCALGEEPTDADSAEWSTWAAHRIGCDTAWTFMHLQGVRPD